MDVNGDASYGMEISDGDSQTNEQVQIPYNNKYDKPPWLLSVLLGYQQILPNIVQLASVLIQLGPLLCILHNDPSNGDILSVALLLSGLSTLLNLYIGTRSPIILMPSLMNLNLPFMDFEVWNCPSHGELYAMGSENRAAVWRNRLLDIQGAVLCLSIVKIVLGYSGFFGLLVRLISPLTMSVMVIIIGKNYITQTIISSDDSWYIALTSLIMVLIMTQVFNSSLPIPWYTLSKGWHKLNFPGLKTFCILLSTLLAVILCIILSSFEESASSATVVPRSTLDAMSWLTFNYPFQWGWPTIGKYAFSLLMPNFFTNILVSISEFYVCAAICGEIPPSPKIVSHGIGATGLGSFLSGIFGGGSVIGAAVGNCGTLGVTKVSSTRLIILASALMIFVSFFGQLSKIFYSIPIAIICGIQCVSLTVYVIFGISSLQFVSMKSHRNIFILGFSLYASHFLSELVRLNHWLRTGSVVLDSFLYAFIGTDLTIGTILVILLDNILPGSLEERGLTSWNRKTRNTQGYSRSGAQHYFDSLFSCC